MMSIQSKFGLLWVCVMLLVCDTLMGNFIGDKQFTRGKIVVKQYKLDNEVTVGELKSVDPDTELFKTVKALTGPNGGKLLEQLTQTSALAVGAPASDLPPEISFIVLGATPIRGTFIGKNRIVVRLPKSVYGGFISIRPPNAPLSQTTIRAVTPDQLTNPAGGVLHIPIICNGETYVFLMVKADKLNDEGLIMAWVLDHEGCYYPGTIDAATLTDTGSITFNIPDDVYEKGGLCKLATPMESLTRDSPIFMMKDKPLKDLQIVTEAGKTLCYTVKLKKDPTAVNTAGVIDTVSLEGAQAGEFWYHIDNDNRVITAYVTPNIVGDLTFKSLGGGGKSSGITSTAAVYAGYNKMNHMLAADANPNAAKNYDLNVHRLLQDDSNGSVIVPFEKHVAHIFNGMRFDAYSKIWGNHKYNSSDIDMISSQSSGSALFAINAHGDNVVCSIMSIVHATKGNIPQLIVAPGSEEDTEEDVESVCGTVCADPSGQNWFLKVNGHDPDKADSVVQVGQFKLIPNSDPPMMAMNWITMPTPSFKINKIRMRLLKADGLKPQIYVVCTTGKKVRLGILDVSNPDKPSLSFQDSPFITTDVSSTCIAMNNSGKVIISSSYEDGGKINYGVYQIKPAANLTDVTASLLSKLEIVVPARFDAVALNNDDAFVAVYYKTDTNDKYIANGSIDKTGTLIFDAENQSIPFVAIPGGGVIERTHADVYGAAIALDNHGYYVMFDSYFGHYTGNLFLMDGNLHGKYNPDSFANELTLQAGAFQNPAILFPALPNDNKASDLVIGARAGSVSAVSLAGLLTGYKVVRTTILKPRALRALRALLSQAQALRDAAANARIGLKNALAAFPSLDPEEKRWAEATHEFREEYRTLAMMDGSIEKNLTDLNAAKAANDRVAIAKYSDYLKDDLRIRNNATRDLTPFDNIGRNIEPQVVGVGEDLFRSQEVYATATNASLDNAIESISLAAEVDDAVFMECLEVIGPVDIILIAASIIIFQDTLYRTIRMGLIQANKDTLNAN